MSGIDNKSWPIPEGLCPLGQTAAEALGEFFAQKGIEYHGGGGRFYSPAQWAERGEQWGLKGVLVVTHDGGIMPGRSTLTMNNTN